MTCRPIICFFPTPFVHVDPAKYLLTRLCLRKPGKWHRLSSLRYQHELGDNITAILEMLCVSSKPNTTEHHAIKQEEQEVIDLIFHEMDLQDAMKPKPPPASLLEQPKVEAGPSSVKIEDISEQPCGDLSFFAQDHTYAELPELLNCLSLEELRQLAKNMKIRKPCVNVSSLPILNFCHQQRYLCSEQCSRACWSNMHPLNLFYHPTLFIREQRRKISP